MFWLQTLNRHQQFHRLVLQATIGLSLSTPLATQAEVVITNTPNGSQGGTSIERTSWKAIVFRTGPYTTRLNSVQLGLNPPPPGTLNAPSVTENNLAISLWSTTTNGPAVSPNSRIATGPTIGSLTINTRNQIYTFSGFATSSSFNLQANTNYALAISSETEWTSSSRQALRWSYTGTTTPTQTQPTGLEGFAYLSSWGSSDQGTTWTLAVIDYNTIVLNVDYFLRSIAPQAYAAFQNVGLNALRLQRDTLLSQAGECKAIGWVFKTGTPLCAFATGGNANSTISGNGDRYGYDSAIAGGFYGVELQASRLWTLGLAYGYGTAALSNFGPTSDSISSSINSGSLYGVYRPSSNWTIKGLLGYSGYDLKGQRTLIAIGNGMPITGNSSANGMTAAVLADYSIGLSPTTAPTVVTLKPKLGLAYGAYQQNGIAEMGDPDMDFDIAPHTSQSLLGTIAAELSAAIPLNPQRSQVLQPRLAVAYQVDALADSTGNTALDATLPSANAIVNTTGQSRGINDLTITGSLDYSISGKGSLYATVSYETFSTGSQFSYGGGLRFSF